METMTSLWKNTKFVCGHHADSNDNPTFTLKTGGHSLYYQCTKNNPLALNDGEHPCNVIIDIKTYEAALDHISKKIINAELEATVINLTNYKWKYKNYEFNILLHKNDEFIVSVTDIKHNKKRA